MLSSVKILLVILLMLCLTAGQVSAAGNPVNINVVNTDVRDILTALASVGGVSIVADDSVTGKMTIQLADIPFDTALDIVTKTKGLAYQKLGSVIIVATPDKLTKGFGTTQVIKLSYAKADEVKKTLVAVIPEDRLKVDEATNSLIFTGSLSETEQIRKTLAELDIPYQQISLEAQVIAINKNSAKDLGVDWKWEATPQYAERTAPTYEAVVVGGVPYRIETAPSTVTRDQKSGIIQFGRNPEGYPYEFYYQAKISALVSDGKAKILAKPNITTINGKEANILIGDRIPILVTTIQNGQTINTIDYVEAGIKLKYTPRINADGQITATVHTEVSSPTLVPEMKAFRITTREAETQVRMKDGETMVIGGLIGSDESGGTNKVPFLSDIPILGSLFKSSHKSKNETEVMIFLTAKIMKDGEKKQ